MRKRFALSNPLVPKSRCGEIEELAIHSPTRYPGTEPWSIFCPPICLLLLKKEIQRVRDALLGFKFLSSAGFCPRDFQVSLPRAVDRLEIPLILTWNGPATRGGGPRPVETRRDHAVAGSRCGVLGPGRPSRTTGRPLPSDWKHVL